MFVSGLLGHVVSPSYSARSPARPKGTQDDAWQASVLSQHQGSCRGGRGCSGAWSLPVTGFLPTPPAPARHCRAFGKSMLLL